MLAREYVVTKIDVDEMKGGKDVAAKLRKDKTSGGIPWMVVLDESGKELVTSDGPDGNIGCPVQPEEVSWFLQMLRKTAQNYGDDDYAAMTDLLEEFAKKHRR